MTLDPASLARAFARRPGASPRSCRCTFTARRPISTRSSLSPAATARASSRIARSAHGARLHGRRLGTFGDIAAFSFYPTKNLGALGDGGVVVTSDEALSARVRELREYGWRERYVSAVPGMNSRLDPLQAAVLGVKLPALDDDNARRAGNWRGSTTQGLAGTTLRFRRAGPAPSTSSTNMSCAIPRATRLRERLAARGIGTLVHYPVPVHVQQAYRGRIAIAPGGLRRKRARRSRRC